MSDPELPASGQVADLVTFQAPPVNEVVLSVQFETPVVDDVVALAEFWPTIRADFPHFERHPPIVPAREDFGVPPSPQKIEFQMFTEPPSQRYWFLSEDRTRLVQLQPDRFILNWRQLTAGATYPRYRELRAQFQGLYEAFLAALGPERRDQAVAALCEVSYINHIEARSAEHAEYHAHLARILKSVQAIGDPVVGDPEDTQFHQRHRLTDPSGSGEPIGRLHVSAVPGYRQADGMPIYVVTLLARGRPPAGSLPGTISFFDFGRDLAVREFVNITTEEMHSEWRMELHGAE